MEPSHQRIQPRQRDFPGSAFRLGGAIFTTGALRLN
jgi:hypothetical protein